MRFPTLCGPSRGGNTCFRIWTTRSPKRVVKPSKMRCGYDSDTVPREAFGISARKTTLCNENDAVGPCGKCETVIAVGVPLCSCRRIVSLNVAALALESRLGVMRLPRFSLIAVGSSNLISFEKALSRVDGLRDVVTNGL